ncbi:MAG: hypothetical protein ABI867_23200 [Kofleriaceae bacterium]
MGNRLAGLASVTLALGAPAARADETRSDYHWDFESGGGIRKLGDRPGTTSCDSWSLRLGAGAWFASREAVSYGAWGALRIEGNGFVLSAEGRLRQRLGRHVALELALGPGVRVCELPETAGGDPRVLAPVLSGGISIIVADRVAVGFDTVLSYQSVMEDTGRDVVATGMVTATLRGNLGLGGGIAMGIAGVLLGGYSMMVSGG